MKKFIFMIAALVCCFSINAQSIETPKLTDNVYMSVRYGVTALTHPGCNGYQNWAHSLAQQSSLQFGKYITPKFALALDGTLSWDTFSHQKMSEYTVPFVSVTALGKYRFIDTNKFAVTAVAGPGWVHGFVKNGTDNNDLMTKCQLEFAYKVNDRLNLEIVPEWNYNLTSTGHKMQPYFDSRQSWYGVNVGVSYRLGASFRECPYTYTQSQVDALNAQINNLRAELDKKPTKETVTVTKNVEVIKTVPVQSVYTVTFAKNSYELTEVAMTTLNQVTGTVEVIATASPEGSATHNQVLSENRANEVKKYLENRNVKVVSAKGIGVDGATSNRIATIYVK